MAVRGGKLLDRLSPLPTSSLAEPWRRLAASVTDVLILLALHLVVLAPLVLLVEGATLSKMQWVSVMVSWAYVWVGWGFFGATLGKALWGIRIVTEDGGRLTPLRAALRCLGYGLASLPLKAGLLPILWDPRRQGWHDRIARTLVVKASALPHFQPPPPPPAERPEPIMPDMKFAWQSWWVPFSLYTLLALVMTYPLLLHFRSHRLGGPGDGSVFMWNYWYFSHALDTGKPLTKTDFLFYPETVSLLYHTMNWFNCLLAVPLLKLFSLTVTYNLLYLFTMVACAFSLYLATCSLTKDRLTSFIAGLAFGFSPYFTAHGMAHMNLLSAQFLPLFTLSFYAALTTLRIHYSILAGLLLALTSLCDWYYFVFALTIAVCLKVGVHVSFARPTLKLFLRRVGFVSLSLVIAFALLSPLLVPMLQEKTASRYMNVPTGLAYSFKSDLVDFITPSPLHPWALPVPQKRGIEWVVTPGIVMLVLSAIGLRRCWKHLLPWLLTALVSAVLACGPSLTLAGRSWFNRLTLLALGGVPGSGFDPPWTTNELISLSLSCLSAEPSLFTSQAGVVLPFAWLSKLVPVLKPFKVPARFAVVTLLCIGFFAAFGLSWLHQSWQARWGSKWARLPVFAVAALILFEYLILPCPLFPTAVHSFYHQLSNDPADFALVEVPLNSTVSEYQYFQTVHQKRLLAATLSRNPPDAFRFISQNSLLRLLSVEERPYWGLTHRMQQIRPLALPVEQFPKSYLQLPNWDNALKNSLSQLLRLRARFIIVHKQWVTHRSLERVDELLSRQLRLPVVWDDEEIKVYRL